MDILFNAARNGDVNFVKTLLSNGFDANSKDEIGRQAIHFAAISDRKEMIKLLLDEGNVSVDATTINGYTPLSRAVDYLSLSSIVYLVSRKADCNVADTNGETVLHLAFRYWNECTSNGDDCRDKAKLKGCDEIEARFRFQSSNLGIHCIDAAVIHFLIEKGNADVTMEDKHGITPLDFIPTKFARKRHFFATLPLQVNVLRLVDRCNKLDKKIKLLTAKIERLTDKNSQEMQITNSDLQEKIAGIDKMQKENDFLTKRLTEVDKRLDALEKEKSDLKTNPMLKENKYDETSQRSKEEIKLLSAKIDFLCSNRCCESCKQREAGFRVFCGRSLCDQCEKIHNQCHVCDLIRRSNYSSLK